MGLRKFEMRRLKLFFRCGVTGKLMAGPKNV